MSSNEDQKGSNSVPESKILDSSSQRSEIRDKSLSNSKSRMCSRERPFYKSPLKKVGSTLLEPPKPSHARVGSKLSDNLLKIPRGRISFVAEHSISNDGNTPKGS